MRVGLRDEEGNKMLLPGKSALFTPSQHKEKA